MFWAELVGRMSEEAHFAGAVPILETSACTGAVLGRVEPILEHSVSTFATVSLAAVTGAAKCRANNRRVGEFAGVTALRLLAAVSVRALRPVVGSHALATLHLVSVHPEFVRPKDGIVDHRVVVLALVPDRTPEETRIAHALVNQLVVVTRMHALQHGFDYRGLKEKSLYDMGRVGQLPERVYL